MVSNDVISPAATCCWAVYHIGHGPVMPDKIEVCRGEIPHLVTKVSYHCYRLEENLRHQDSRTKIEVSATLKFGDLAAEELEIMMARFADIGTVGAGMDMDNVGTDRNMNGHRYAKTSGGSQ